MPRTIIEKLWDSHVVAEQPGAPALLYIDLHLVHEVTSPQAFDGLRERGLKVRRPDLTFATVRPQHAHHAARCPSWTRSPPRRWRSSRTNCTEFGIPLLRLPQRASRASSTSSGRSSA